MRAQFVKYRPKYDCTGAHVTLKHGDRELLGTIISICPDEYLCQVRFFCGDPWPFNPSLSRLEILERAYEEQS